MKEFFIFVGLPIIFIFGLLILNLSYKDNIIRETCKGQVLSNADGNAEFCLEPLRSLSRLRK